MRIRRCIIALIAVLLLGSRSVAAQTSGSESSWTCLAVLQTTYRTLIRALSQGIVERFDGALLFVPQSDGGGDGGGDSGGGSDGGGGGDGGASNGGGDSGGVGGDTSGNGDGSNSDNGTVGDMGDNGDAVTSDPSAINDQTTDPAHENAVLSPTAPTGTLDTAQTAPNYGPGSPGAGDTVDGLSLKSVLPSQSPGSPPRGASGPNVGINAVIVSGAPTPWESIGKVAQVSNVFVMGGIIALGQTALTKPLSGVSGGAADNPPAWLKFKPDARYLNGSILPPVVPNVIDIRTISYTEEAIENPRN